MLNEFDQLSSYRDSMDDMKPVGLNVIASMTEIADLLYLFDLPDNTSKTEVISSDEWSKLVTHFTDMHNQVYQVPNSEGYYIEIDASINSNSILVTNELLTQNKNMYYLLFNNGEVIVNKYLVDESGSNYGDILEWMTVSVTNMDVISEAIDELNKGELSASNLRTCFQDSVSKMNQDSKAILNAISSSVSGSTVLAQASSLMSALKEIGSGVLSAVVNGNKIQFNSQQFTVSTAFLIPAQSIVSGVTGILSLIVTIWSPILGAALAGVGALASAAVKAINDNNNDYPIFQGVDERANDCYAPPICQLVVPQQWVPQSVKARIQKRGIIKCVNGMLTIYIWAYTVDSNKNITEYGMEIYINATFDPSYAGNDNDLLNYQALHSSVYSSVDNRVNFSGTTPTQLHTNLSYLLDDSNGGSYTGDGGYLDNPNNCYSKAVGRLAGSLALLGYIMICLKYGTTASSSTTVTPQYWLNYSGSINTNGVARDIILSMLSSYETLGSTMTQIVNNNSNTPSGASALWAVLVNNVIPSIKFLAEEGNTWVTDINSYWWLYITEYYDLATVSNQSLPDIQTRGWGLPFIFSTSILNKENAYVYPPKSRYNIWLRIAVASVIVVAIVTTSIIVGVKIKRSINYNAAKMRNKIDLLKQNFDEDPTPENYRALYKANKKYNKLWGKLSGTSYDGFNGWIDYPGSIDSEASGLLGIVSNGINSDFDDVMDVLKGSH